MNYLLDTNVISELRKSAPNPGVVAFIEAAEPGALFLSVMTIGEITAGADKVRLRDAAFAARLDRWLDELLIRFAQSILQIDVETAMLWGALSAKHRRSDGDMLIAASAMRHGLTLVTRNVRHFEIIVPHMLDPFRV